MAKELKLSRSWHTNALVVLLVVWSIWTFVGLVKALAEAPRGMGLGWTHYVVFLSVPMLIGFGAYLLFMQSKWRPLPFLLLPVMYFWSAVLIYPNELGLSHRQLDAAYIAQFPLMYRICAAFFLVCALYGFFLNKRQQAA